VGAAEVDVAVRWCLRPQDEDLGLELLEVERHPGGGAGERGAFEGQLPADARAPEADLAVGFEPVGAVRVVGHDDPLGVERQPVGGGERPVGAPERVDACVAQADLAGGAEPVGAEEVLVDGQPVGGERRPAGVSRHALANEREPPTCASSRRTSP